jgi:hypothetical protein
MMSDKLERRDGIAERVRPLDEMAEGTARMAAKRSAMSK